MHVARVRALTPIRLCQHYIRVAVLLMMIVLLDLIELDFQPIVRSTLLALHSVLSFCRFVVPRCAIIVVLGVEEGQVRHDKLLFSTFLVLRLDFGSS